MLLINLHPLKHSYVQYFGESNFAPILEFAIFYHFRHICIKKIIYIFRVSNYFRSRIQCYFDYLMISYWFDINILSKIKLHEPKWVLFLQNIKKWQKKISAQSDTAIF